MGLKKTDKKRFRTFRKNEFVFSLRMLPRRLFKRRLFFTNRSTVGFQKKPINLKMENKAGQLKQSPGILLGLKRQEEQIQGHQKMKALLAFLKRTLNTPGLKWKPNEHTFITNLFEKTESLIKDKEISSIYGPAVYVRSGSEPNLLTEMLEAEGFTVKRVQSGYQEWDYVIYCK